jgi:hypothetical protein
VKVVDHYGLWGVLQGEKDQLEGMRQSSADQALTSCQLISVPVSIAVSAVENLHPAPHVDCEHQSNGPKELLKTISSFTAL